jgi:hypothetical protein
MNRVQGPVERLLAALIAVVGEGLKLAREVLVIPIQLWLAVAEPAGAAVYAVWQRVVVPVADLVADVVRAALDWAEVEITPERAAITVALAAALALAASQFIDYRGISVGTQAYSGVESVAPPPEIGRELTGSAHAWLMLPIAVLAVVVIVFAARGRWQTARLLVPLGAIVIIAAVLVDVPAGLDEGSAAVEYLDAEASLLEGFWAQVAAGAVLIASGPLLAAHLRPRGAGADSARALQWPWRRRRESGLGSSPVTNSPIGTST